MSGATPPGPYLILGAGRAGVSAAEALASRSERWRIRIWDEHDRSVTRSRTAHLKRRGVRVELGGWRPALLTQPAPATVIKSPGVPADHPAVLHALAAGIPVIDELELGRQLGGPAIAAVTGTDGKSTVCALLARALGTPGKPLTVAGNTSFGPPLSAVGSARAVVVEVSSYQLEFTERLPAELAVLTNLTTEHLQRHGTLDAYAAVKRRLFIAERPVPRAAVNVDSEFGRGLARELSACGSTVATFGSSHGAQYRVLATEWEIGNASVQLTTPAGEVSLRTRLPGSHNAENVAAALASCDLLGVPRERAAAAFAAMPGVPGRWEAIDSGQDFDLLVDFAHTPAALRAVLETARELVRRRDDARLILVLCASGGKDPAKRRPFGMIASELADLVILTEGNPRGEPREELVAGLSEGWLPGAPSPDVVLDRREAIRAAVRAARSSDMVVVMGRGAMPVLYSDAAGSGVPFDDRQVARAELAALVGDRVS